MTRTKIIARITIMAGLSMLNALSSSQAVHPTESLHSNQENADSALSSRTLELLGKKSLFSQYVRSEGGKIFAVYQPWYGTEENNWLHWGGWGNNPSNIHDRGTASVHHPLIGLYDSSERELIRHHIELAKACGIDGFIVDWYGNTMKHDTYVKTILEEAEKQNFTISLLYESRVSNKKRDVFKTHIRFILDNFAESPAYQKVAGIPVIFLFGMTSTGFSVEDYAKLNKELLDESAQNGKNRVFAFVGDTTVNPEYFKVANGLFEWLNMDCLGRSESWRVNPESWEHYARKEAYRAVEHRSDVIVIGSVYGGFDDERLGGGNWGKGTRRFLDDQQGKVVEKTANYTVENGLPWAIIQTFNDWNEGTQFEPSMELGFSRMWSVLKLSARMKGRATDPEKVIRIVEEFARARLEEPLDEQRKVLFNQDLTEVKYDINKLLASRHSAPDDESVSVALAK